MTTLPPEPEKGQPESNSTAGDQPGVPSTPPPPANAAPPQRPATPPPASPPPPAAQPQQGGYQQAPVADPGSNVALNYWLSVFFFWIPALIFYLIDKDKGNAALRTYQRDNLNFALLRTGVWIVGIILGSIPDVIGFVLSFLVGLGAFVLFVFHIIAAVKATASFRNGEKPPFIFNIPLIK